MVYGVLVDAENFHLARRLRWIHVSAAGVGSLLFPALAESEVVLTNGRGLHAVSMAEHALGLMLAFARKLHLARDLQREHRWEQVGLWTEPPPFGQLAGGTLGLVGLGAVGSRAGGARGGAGDARHRRAPAPGRRPARPRTSSGAWSGCPSCSSAPTGWCWPPRTPRRPAG